MTEAIEGEFFPGATPFIFYTPKWRSYGIVIGHNLKTQAFLNYCPFCGAKLPKELSDEHFEAIHDENGKLLDPIPPEFDTDEWWKKRGL